MAHHHESTDNVKEEIHAIKKDIEALVKRLAGLREKSGDVVSEQIDNLSEAISELKHDGEKKGKEVLHDLSVSTRQHPLRNLGYAFGLGVLISLIIK